MAISAAPCVEVKRASDLRVAAGLAGLQAAVGLPFLLAGPGFILDDWFTLYWRWSRGVLGTGGGSLLRARPGAWLSYLVEFGLVGRHPLVAAVLLLVIAMATAPLLYFVCRRLLAPAKAAAVAGAWVLIPDHSTMTRWASTINIDVALVLVLAGALLLDGRTGRRDLAGTALLVAGALCYEAVLPLAAIATVVLPAQLTGRWHPERVVLRVLPLVLTGAWMLAGTSHAGVEQGWFSFGTLYPAHFGWGLTTNRRLGQLLGLAALTGLCVAVLRRRGEACVLVASGVALILAGALPFARDPIQPVFLGDRANVVGAIGAAAAWVGIVLLLSQRRALLVGAAVVLGALWAATGLQRNADFAAAGRDAGRVLHAVAVTATSRPPGVVVIGPGPQWHHGIVGLIGEEKEAVQAANSNVALLARVAKDKADFEATDPALRLDVRTLGRLGPP